MEEVGYSEDLSQIQDSVLTFVIEWVVLSSMLIIVWLQNILGHPTYKIVGLPSSGYITSKSD
jgi:hypothetical protein